MTDEVNELDEFEAAFEAAAEDVELEDEATEELEETLEDQEDEVSEPEEEELDEPTLEELIKERDEYKHKFESNNGRISSMQRQQEELKQQNAHLAAQMAKAGSSNTDTSEAQEKMAQDVSGMSWEELQQDMPDVAEAINKRLQSVIDERLESVNQQIQPITQNLQAQQRDAELAALKSRHEDYYEVGQSSEFREWLGQQPDAVQQLENSDSAADAAYLLDIFKLQNPTESPDSSQKSRQQAQLRRSIAAPSKRMAKRAPAMGSFDDEFDAAVAHSRR